MLLMELFETCLKYVLAILEVFSTIYEIGIEPCQGIYVTVKIIDFATNISSLY